MNKILVLLFLCIYPYVGMATPLPAKQVFHVNAEVSDPNTFVITWQIKDGYFVYADRVHFSQIAKKHQVEYGPLRMPPPSKKIDSQGRSYQIYRHTLKLAMPFLAQQPGERLILLHFQGCSDAGFCYPPEDLTLRLTIDKELALTQIAIEPVTKIPFKTQPVINNHKFADVFSQHHWMITLLLFLGFGVLLSFTPCVLPMIPVLSGILINHNQPLSVKKAFCISLSYVLSQSITYAVIGGGIAILGSNLQVMMQSTFSISLMSGIFILLALSMFGVFELQLPQLQLGKINLLRAKSTKDGSRYLQAAIMGCLSTLILSPCVTPPLIGSLSYIARSGNVLMGSMALFALGFGMGVPLLLVGLSAGKWLPKAGPWMNAIKSFFGVLLLAIAISLMSRILPDMITMLLWAIFLVGVGVYAKALSPALTKRDKWTKSFGAISLTYGIVLLVGAAMGNSSILQPFGNHSAATRSVPAYSVTNINQLQEIMLNANSKPILLDFYADWCIACKIMEKTIFQDPKIMHALQKYLVIKVDVTKNSPEQTVLFDQYQVVAPPTFIFLNSSQKELPQQRIVGEISSQNFLRQILWIKSQ